MIKEKSRNRLARLEDSYPTHRGNEGEIHFTLKAQEILEPWYDKLLTSDKDFFYLNKNHTPEEVFNKCLGDGIAIIASAEAGEDLKPSSLNEVNEAVALFVIEQLKTRYGITL
jgi:hypothetical protein